MTRISRTNADRIMCENGWLSQMPESFQIKLLQNARLLRLKAGHVIFRRGDPAGGIYGLVAGTVVVNTAPMDAIPKLIHIAIPGGWTGEDCFITGKPRRIELYTQSEVWVMHVPLETMEQMAASDSNTIRAFGMISILSADKLLRIIHDLQKKSVTARIASALHRMTWFSDIPISISQENLAILTNTSRKQVNGAIRLFLKSGWIKSGYRSITVINSLALQRHAEEDQTE